MDVLFKCFEQKTQIKLTFQNIPLPSKTGIVGRILAIVTNIGERENFFYGPPRAKNGQNFGPMDFTLVLHYKISKKNTKILFVDFTFILQYIILKKLLKNGND